MSVDTPKWREIGGVWECGDEDEQFFRFRAWNEFRFDVVDYDRWLGGLPPCAARQDLLRLRAAAKAEMQAVRMEPHLHRIFTSRKAIEREAQDEGRIAELEPLAEKGERFSQGKPKGAAGPLRKLVRKMLKQKSSHALTARELWDACKALPGRQRGSIEFGDADAWVPNYGNASFAHFANVVSEEKKTLR